MWLFLVACAPGPQTATPSEAAPVEPAPAEAPAPIEAAEGELQTHMHEHLSRATIAYEALIHGDLPGAREALTWLAEHEPPPLPKGAEPFVGQMRDLAKEGAAAPRYDGVAAKIGEMGTACGGCHQAQKVTPALDVGKAPESSTDVNAHMARHQWAVGALWAGLVTPSDAHWASGVQALSDHPLDEKAFQVPELSEEAKAQAKGAHEAARNAGGLTTAPERAGAFSTIAVACAGCHAEMRGE